MGFIRTIKSLAARREFYKFPVRNHNFRSSIKLYYRYWKDFRKFNDESKRMGQQGADLKRAYPILNEKTTDQGTKMGHYFYQPLWLMKKLKENPSEEHLDIGSQMTMLGFISLEKNLTYLDIRNPNIQIPNFNYIKGSITNLPFESASIDSLSSLHVIEHIGLGRYGDELDPLGHVKAFNEISRVVSKGGDFYLSIPCGSERVDFNAHRVFHPNTIINLLTDFKLISLSGMDKNNDYRSSISIEELSKCSFGCGFFHFKKK